MKTDLRLRNRFLALLEAISKLESEFKSHIERSRNVFISIEEVFDYAQADIKLNFEMASSCILFCHIGIRAKAKKE